MALSHDIHTSIIIDNVLQPLRGRLRALKAFKYCYICFCDSSDMHSRQFLDFDNFLSWSHKYITEIKVVEPTNDSGHLMAGSKIAVAMSTVPNAGLIILPIVVRSSFAL